MGEEGAALGVPSVPWFKSRDVPSVLVVSFILVPSGFLPFLKAVSDPHLLVQLCRMIALTWLMKGK
jgi:hypothetical protein